MAWIRQVELSVGAAGKGLLISDLNVDFEIERSVNGSENYATFTVYNAKQETINNLIKSGNNIIFKAGYEDENNINSIFVGTIIEAITTKDGSDSVTKINAIDYSDNQKGFDFLTFSLSYKEKTELKTVVSDLADTLGISVSGIDNISSTLNNGFNYSGNFKNLVKKIKNSLNVDDVDLYFDNNEMLIYKIGAVSSFDVIKLTPKNGLIRATEIMSDTATEKKSIEVECLINPKLKPHGLIKIDGENVSGNYFIKKIKFYGNNYGGDFNCSMECVE